MEVEKSSKISSRPFFENLTGLRFVGALAVFIFHCFTLHREIWGDFFQDNWFQKIYSVAEKGHVGIILFFVLSGFLITYLLLHENKLKGKINLAKYYMRRVLRIWPLYFLVVLFGFFLFPVLPFGVDTVHQLWMYTLFLSNIDEIWVGASDSLNFLTATWTVAAEEQFYLIWGLLIGIFSFRKKSTYYIFFNAIIIGSLVFRYLNLDDPRTLYYHTFSVMSDLAFGGLVALFAFSGKAKLLFEKLTRIQLILFYVLAALIFIFEGSFLKGVLFTFDRLVPEAIFAFIILEQVYAKKSFYKIDMIPLLYSSGELTYGFYMFHTIYFYYWSIYFESHNYTDHLWQFIVYGLVVFVSTYLTAYLSLHYFERPFLRLKKHFR